MKYYDQSTNDPERNRLIYNRFGDFPLVQLKKNEIKRSFSRSSSSSVRIAPPNKSVMNPNLRAAIMRSNSFQLSSGVPKIIPIKMRAKDDAHQIITNHEPIVDPIYSTSAKSVLDALEKNCRKRINNEELILDRNKKFCMPEVVDSPSAREFVPIMNQSTKRNREQISPVKSSVLSDLPLQNQQSKRLKTKNNALLSSLSSSHYNLIPINSTPVVHKTKSKTSLEYEHQIDDTINADTDTTEKIELSSINQSVLTPPRKSIEKSIPAVSVIKEVTKEKNEQHSTKKLQLFNRKPDPNAMLNRAKFNSEEEDDVRINFVKPKEKILENYDIITYVEKEKLAKMLDGLGKGFQSPTKEASNDTIDSSQVKVLEKQPATISFATSTVNSQPSNPITSVSATLSMPSQTTRKDTESKGDKILSSEVSKISTITSTTPSIQIPKLLTNNDDSSNLIKFTPVNTTPSEAISKAASPLALFSAPITSSSSSVTLNEVNKPNISFAPIEKSTIAFGEAPSKSVVSIASTISTTTNTVELPSVLNSSLISNNSGFSLIKSVSKDPTPSTGFSFGGNSVPFGIGQTNAPKITPATATSTITKATPLLNLQNAAASTPGGNNLFSFGISSVSQPVSIATTTTSSLNSGGIQAAPLSSINLTSLPTFGSNTASDFAKSVNPIAPKSTFSFGGNSKPETIQQSPMGIIPSTTTNSASPFSFGSSSSIAPASSGLSAFNMLKPETQTNEKVFSFSQKPQSAPVFPTAAVTTASSGFSFGNQQPTNALSAQPSQSVGFNFGQGNSNQQQQPQQQQQPNNPSGMSNNSIFSRLAEKQTETVKPFSFNGSNSQQASSQNPFGGSNNIAATNNNSPFGASATSQSSMSVSSNSLFGQNMNNNVNNNVNNSNSIFPTANQNTAPVFGNNSMQQQNQPQMPSRDGNLFSFGSSATNTAVNNNNQQQPNTNSTFNFGGNNNAQSANNILSSNNIFGSKNDNNSGQNVSASFTFNPGSGAISSNQVSSTAAAAPPPYQFGGSSNVSASFSFSGGDNKPPQPTHNMQNSNNNGFNFGTNNANVPGGFNFQSQAQVNMPQPSPGGGLFNIGTSGNQQRRTIRAAVRRFK